MWDQKLSRCNLWDQRTTQSNQLRFRNHQRVGLSFLSLLVKHVGVEMVDTCSQSLTHVPNISNMYIHIMPWINLAMNKLMRGYFFNDLVSGCVWVHQTHCHDMFFAWQIIPKQGIIRHNIYVARLQNEWLFMVIHDAVHGESGMTLPAVFLMTKVVLRRAHVMSWSWWWQIHGLMHGGDP